jgi:hypothetical protein
MKNVRLSRGLCAVVGQALSGSHATLEALFVSAGAPGEPPSLSHQNKWKEWLFRAGQDSNVDSLNVLGNVLEEFMDVPPSDQEARDNWEAKRKRVVEALEADGLQYYQGGRVLPNGKLPNEIAPLEMSAESAPAMPRAVEDVLTRLVRGLPRAMYPLIKRRKGATALTFRSEYDLQDLLHALLRPWVADIRPEEFTPSYAGSSTRMDFLLPAHSLVIELKLIRDHAHARQIGKELTIDIAHYTAHPGCKHLWCIIYDPDKLIPNVAGLTSDLEGERQSPKGSVHVKVEVIS